MCNHWQSQAAKNLYDVYSCKSNSELQARYIEELVNNKTAEIAAINYHGSIEKITTGYYSGWLRASNMYLAALEKIAEERSFKLVKNFEVPKADLTFFQKIKIWLLGE